MGYSPNGQIAAYAATRYQLHSPRVARLAGGVSGDTFLVETPAARLVLKRALERLRVSGEWRAKPERAMTEAAAIEYLHELSPEHTPALVDADPLHNTLLMTAAPAEWISWKAVLLDDDPDPTAGPVATAAALGGVLGTWHARSWNDHEVAARFADYEAFDQLRITPFHRAVAAAHPAVAGAVEQCAHELEVRRECLVHGDYSPKNVLVGSDGLMVLDFEVAHFGAAVFDLAFMTCHLALKALHLPYRCGVFADAGAALLGEYLLRSPQADAPDLADRLLRHTACLLLARVDGLSPATYLNAATSRTVRSLALDLLANRSGSDFWTAVIDAAHGSVA